MITLTHYAKVKNKYCIAYFGPIKEYLIQLAYLRPIIEVQLPGIEIHLAYRDEFHNIVADFDRIIPISLFKIKRLDFAYVREIKFDFDHHPILELLKESNISVPADAFPLHDRTNKCVVVTKGINPPTFPLLYEQSEKLIRMGKTAGYEVIVDGDVKNAGWVMGVESDKLYWAGCNGIKTSLVPTGLGMELYQKMFSKTGEILNV